MALEKDDIDVEEGYKEAMAEAMHTELKSMMRQVVQAIKSIPKEDQSELKKIIPEIRDVLNNVGKVVGEIGKQKAPEVNVETNQDKVVDAIKKLADVMNGIDKRLMAIENKEYRPLATKLKATYAYDKIDYVIIEYKK